MFNAFIEMITHPPERPQRDVMNTRGPNIPQDVLNAVADHPRGFIQAVLSLGCSAN